MSGTTMLFVGCNFFVFFMWKTFHFINWMKNSCHSIGRNAKNKLCLSQDKEKSPKVIKFSITTSSKESCQCQRKVQVGKNAMKNVYSVLASVNSIYRLSCNVWFKRDDGFLFSIFFPHWNNWAFTSHREQRTCTVAQTQTHVTLNGTHIHDVVNKMNSNCSIKVDHF